MLRNPILVALDVPTIGEALELVTELRDVVGGFKVGMELCMAEGTPQVIDAISGAGGAVFLDLKFKDIPNTVAGAARGMRRPGVAMFNVHTDGGAAMMRAAVAEVRDLPDRPLVLGVTVLTSIDAPTLHEELRVPGPVADQVLHLALLARDAGLDGVVCSAHEVATIRAACGEAFVTVVPGIRPDWPDIAVSDQRRVLTPAAAVHAGAHFIVIGRPITRPPARIGRPVDAARRILDEIAAVPLGER